MDKAFGFPIKIDDEGRRLIGIPSKVDGKTNWLRYYDAPPPGDYEGLRNLLAGFNHRFISHVWCGDTIRPSESFIQKQEGLLAENKKQAKPTTQSSTKDILEKTVTPDLSYSDLVVAYQKRAVNAIGSYIDKRAEIGSEADDTPEMVELLGVVDESFKKVGEYAGPDGINMRREDGSTDTDGALHEMFTEAFNILMGAKPGGRRYFENMFLSNRYKKISDAWDKIDDAGEALIKLIENDPELSKTEIPLKDQHKVKLIDLIKDLPEVAKQRTNLMRSDPDYGGVDLYLRTIRSILVDMTREISPEAPIKDLWQAYLVSRSNGRTEQAYGLMREGVELIYDMSKIRLGRADSVKKYVERVSEHLARSQGVSASGPG